ncbi:hypothetical protein N7539_007851 [Penicillium diatomitis]|uniref:Copper transport protein n=1 Tax=Penicillium diatomitis TaxID=2819901 RepID=A0A9W9WU75_9EURO|nr:uncharacterized protein N7539_007851 [Penicillium diatomitis]KAJ5475564.1 hypothetical protein N7539_007851 [Penicillium diatomitis]
MDHSMHMDHGGMDHGGMDHGDMDMGQCSMNMIFTWSSKNLCIIFRQWRITGPVSFILSLILIVLLTAGYEGVRHATRKYEARHNQRLNAIAVSTNTGGGRDSRSALARRGKLVLAALYAVQVFYSFFIMLLFMTYNGMVMLAVAVGAFVGHLIFAEDAPATKSIACH